MQNAIHMLKPVTGSQMNSFLITTASGKVIAIDGGWRADADYFLDYLRGLTGQAVPHIDAWFLTHPHSDHIETFLEIAERHAGELTFDKVYFNFPSEQFLASEDAGAAGTLREFYRALPLFADKVAFVSGGDRYVFGDAAIHVLYTHDPELNTNVCNNASMVFRLDLGGKSALFTGDCGVEAGQKIVRLWKDSGLLDCDICQMAHHGQNGCDRAFYEAVSPKTCLWATPLWLWNNDAGQGYNTHIWQTIEVRGWMDEIGATTHHAIKDGTRVCVL